MLFLLVNNVTYFVVNGQLKHPENCPVQILQGNISSPQLGHFCILNSQSIVTIFSQCGHLSKIFSFIVLAVFLRMLALYLRS